MAIAIAQGVAQEVTLSSGIPSTPATGINTSATGSTFIAAIRPYSPSITTVTDTFSNSYSQVIAPIANGSTSLYVYICTNGAGGTGHKPTITQSSGDLASVSFFEITGGATASILDGTPTSNLDASSPFDSPMTTSSATTLVIGIGAGNCVANPTTFTPGTGFTLHSGSTFANGTDANTICVMYQRVTAAGTYGPNFTQSSGNNSAVVTFALKELAGGSSLTANNGTFSLAGQSSVLNLAIPAGFGSFSLSGQAATLTQIGGNQTILAAPGAFNLIGASSQTDASIVSATGIYTLSGQTANLSGPGAAGSKGSMLLLGVGN